MDFSVYTRHRADYSHHGGRNWQRCKCMTLRPFHLEAGICEDIKPGKS